MRFTKGQKKQITFPKPSPVARSITKRKKRKPENWAGTKTKKKNADARYSKLVDDASKD
jgi:hypothetical protein